MYFRKVSFIYGTSNHTDIVSNQLYRFDHNALWDPDSYQFGLEYDV